MNDDDRQHLQRCVELAEQALDAGDEPFGSVLVQSNGSILREARNRVETYNAISHPEFEVARWASDHVPASARQALTVYTSGEHCPMCSAAHAWAGLGRIVYASSSEQLASWLADLGASPAPVTMHPVADIAPGITVDGPEPVLAEQVRQLHYRRYGRS